MSQISKNVNFVEAQYSEQKVTQYQGNPLIEALPEIIERPEEMAKLLSCYPSYDKKDLDLPAVYRAHLVENIKDFFKPLTVHFGVEQIISRMIRTGYVHRNPLYWVIATSKQTNSSKYIFQNKVQSTSSQLGVFGISGIGKTTMINKILSMYPQLIEHTNYKGDKAVRYQIPWLKAETPAGGSIKGLCLNILKNIDDLFNEDNYYRKGARKTKAELLPYLQRVAELHHIGLLVFDELQNLRGIGSKLSEEMLNFFVELSNTVNVPIILIGTLKALPLFDSEFRNARRITGEGTIIWNRIEKDIEWKAFTKSLFKYQWTKYPITVTDKIVDTLYEESQGITDVAIKLFMLAQYRAIHTGTEQLTVGLIKAVARENLKPIKPMLDALKNNVKEELNNFEDIYLKKFFADALSQEANKVIIYGSSETDSEQIQNSDESKKRSIATQISSWLVQGGFEIKESEDAVKQIIKEYGIAVGVGVLRREAYSLLSNKMNSQKDIEKKVDPIQRQKSKMLKAYDESVEKGITGYEALKQAKFIAELNEFLS